MRPRELGPLIIERAREGEVAVLFGREDRGLGNEALDLCHSVAIVPTHSDYSSLNLAQACLLTCYEIFLASQDGVEPLPTGRRAEGAATQADLEETYSALEFGLKSIRFFKGDRSPESVMRTLRTLISRAEPDLHEARLFRAVGFEVGHCVARLEGAKETRADPPSGEDPDG